MIFVDPKTSYLVVGVWWWMSVCLFWNEGLNSSVIQKLRASCALMRAFRKRTDKMFSEEKKSVERHHLFATTLDASLSSMSLKTVGNRTKGNPIHSITTDYQLPKGSGPLQRKLSNKNTIFRSYSEVIPKLFRSYSKVGHVETVLQATCSTTI